MRQRKLGESDITVSEICLGSMTWGTQNDYTEASAQINFASEHGVNFIDTAELYPTTPLSAETQGDTEAIIGRYMKQNNCKCLLFYMLKILLNVHLNITSIMNISIYFYLCFIHLNIHLFHFILNYLIQLLFI